MKFIRIFVAMAVLALAGRADGQTVTILYSFSGPPKDSGGSQFTPVQGSDGNFYGIADGAGLRINNGSVFRISPSGSFTNLYLFSGRSDGGGPLGGLIQGVDGYFYGTTEEGGNTNLNQGFGFGTVFRISPTGVLTTLYSFAGSSDGARPTGSLVQGKDGNFYGTAHFGGITTTGSPNGCGTIFRISPSGTCTTLYSFLGYPSDGENPDGGLVQGNDGNFYGTTEYGANGTMRNAYGYGTVFRISPSGTYTTLYSFTGFSSGPCCIVDGENPNGGLAQGSDGNFYGTTVAGGVFSYQNPDGFGTVFRIGPSGIYTSLYAFTSLPNDGYYPDEGLVQGSDGNFYGTASEGGTHGSGTVFRISSGGNYTNLYSFGNYVGDGAYPYGGLVQGSDGNFYGTTAFGGINNSGTVFCLSIPLNPPANQISSAQVDSSGTNLVFSIPSVFPETYQLQFSPSMNPTNWSNVVGVCVSNSIGAALTVTNVGGATGAQGFYRFAITP